MSSRFGSQLAATGVPTIPPPRFSQSVCEGPQAGAGSVTTGVGASSVPSRVGAIGVTPAVVPHARIGAERINNIPAAQTKKRLITGFFTMFISLPTFHDLITDGE